MAIQYSGGPIVNVSWVQTLGTRRELVDKIVLELANAGWTVKSGGGTGDVVLESATTPQGLKVRVRVWDPGSGNCARFALKNPSESLTSGASYLLPNAGTKIWRIVANKYQMFVWTQGSTSAREHLGFGVLWIPSFLEGAITTVAAFVEANGRDDSDTAATASFRTGMGTLGTTWARCSMMLDTYVLDLGNGQNASVRLFVTAAGYADYNCLIWHDDSRFLMDPLIGFGVTAASEYARLRGMLWDAVILSGGVAADSNYTFDGHNWVALTGNGSGSGSALPGTLLLATS